MQKKSKKASILIWAIFLSLIISVSFLSISTKITGNLKNNSSNNNNIKQENEIKTILNTSILNTQKIGNKTVIIENTSLEKSLKNNEVYDIKFNKKSIINLEVQNSGILLYNTGTSINNILTGSIQNISISPGKTLKLTNYSGYAKFKLISDNKFEIAEKKYKIIEDIGSKKIIKTRGIIK